MKRVLTLMLCVQILSSVALAAGSYFPSTPGKSWKYSSGETQQLGQPVVIKGVNVVPTAHIIGGRTVSEDLNEYRNGGVFLRGVRIGAQVIWYNPPLTIYPSSPLSLNQHWESASGSLKLSSRVIGSEPLSLAAGNFNTLVIRTDVNSGAATSSQFSYFVPGLGVVRFQTAGGQVTDLQK